MIYNNNDSGFGIKNRYINVWFISQRASLELPILQKAVVVMRLNCE